LQYAVQDTVYLADLYRQLDEKLCRKGMKYQAQKAFDEMTAVHWREKTLDFLGHRKIKGYESLAKDQQERLKRLYRWRFKKAKQTNRAMFLILSDQELLSLSRAKWQLCEELQFADILSAEKTNLYGCELEKTLASEC